MCGFCKSHSTCLTWPGSCRPRWEKPISVVSRIIVDDKSRRFPAKKCPGHHICLQLSHLSDETKRLSPQHTNYRFKTALFASRAVADWKVMLEEASLASTFLAMDYHSKLRPSRLRLSR